jgi:lipopolysaccharide/colanic/teichoic acid biosynthesis glycosyltransferase
VLRRLSLDELPQLVNVVRGDMSLVGPRPEDPRYVALYTDEQRQVLSRRPGITSLASVAYRHEERLLQGENWETTYIHYILPHKLALDLQYVNEQNIWLDFKILWRTVVAVFK